MRLLVAIPCLNEAQTIAAVIQRIPRELENIEQVDVAIVDDGSTDNTAALAAGVGARVLSHGTNRGVGAAFQTALAHAIYQNYDLMVTIDADGQFAPEDIPKLVVPLTSNQADFVTASRFIDPSKTPDMPPVKLWGNKRMSALISRLTGRTYYDVSCGFRAYSREAMLHLNLHGEFTYTQEVFLDLSFKQLRIMEIPVVVQYFDGRVSRVANSITKYAIKTASIILRVYRDYHPIRFFWGLAGVTAVLGLMFSSVLIKHYLATGMFSGQIWSGFVGGGLLFTGFTFFMIGLIADMLVRQRRNQERVLYMLKRFSGDNNRDDSTASQ